MQITYTNVFIIDSQQVPFKELSDEQKREIGNYMRRVPLGTLGDVEKRKSA